jgi:hypothetical protein
MSPRSTNSFNILSSFETSPKTPKIQALTWPANHGIVPRVTPLGVGALPVVPPGVAERDALLPAPSSPEDSPCSHFQPEHRKGPPGRQYLSYWTQWGKRSPPQVEISPAPIVRRKRVTVLCVGPAESYTYTSAGSPGTRGPSTAGLDCKSLRTETTARSDGPLLRNPCPGLRLRQGAGFPGHADGTAPHPRAGFLRPTYEPTGL